MPVSRSDSLTNNVGASCWQAVIKPSKAMRTKRRVVKGDGENIFAFALEPKVPFRIETGAQFLRSLSGKDDLTKKDRLKKAVFQ